MSFIETKNLVKTYRVGNKKIYAVNNINLKINKNEMVILFGPSGSGKTTLLMLLCALIRPTSGKIFVDGEEITKLSESKAVEWRRKNTGFVFQKINLIDFLNVYDNVVVPLAPSNLKPIEVKKRALNLIEKVGLKDRINHKPSQLSVGEQQRVAIARALITNPRIVLADEPTSHLDSETGKEIVALMKHLQKDLQITFIIATHDPDLLSLADRTVRMRDGKISTMVR